MIAALWITMLINNPRTSTAIWRLRPLIFFPPSYPDSIVLSWVDLTVWLSIILAVGVGLRYDRPEYVLAHVKPYLFDPKHRLSASD